MEIQPILNAAAAIAPAEPRPSAPSASAAARFEQLMAPDDPAPADAVATAIAPAAAPAAPSSRTMGDAILSGLRGVSTDMSTKWNAVSQALEAPNLRMNELLRLQLTVSQMSVQYDLVGKAISRSTQNIDQLVKLQ